MTETHATTETPPSSGAPPSSERDARTSAPDVPAADTTVRLHLTASALDEIREMLADAGLEQEGGLRLTARTGAGCSAPLQYGMFLEEAPEEDDAVLTVDDEVRIFLRPTDAWTLDGLLVDYVTSPELGEGFAFRHPGGRNGRSC